MSSYELTEWMALFTVEAAEAEERREDPERAKQQDEERRRERRGELPGVLVRAAEVGDEDPVLSEDDGPSE